MRVLAWLLLSLLAVAHADVLIRSEEPDDVPGLHHETFYVVDDSPEARNADGASPVKGMMTHTSASGPRALAALFGSSGDAGHWSSWMDQQINALNSVHEALMPAITEAPPRRRGCSRHKRAMGAAMAAAEGVPRSYSSPDEALLQRMAAARLTPQLLSALMRERDEPDVIAVVGAQPRPRPQIATTESSLEAADRGSQDVFAKGEFIQLRATDPSVVNIVCNDTHCTVHYEPLKAEPQAEFLLSSRVLDARSSASWTPQRRVSFEDMAAERRGLAYGQLAPALQEYSGGDWQSRTAANDMLSPLNPGFVLFVFLFAACVFVWARLAILCCALRRCGGRRHRRRRCMKGAAEAPLLEPLAPESAAADSLAIYTDALYAPPKGLHPPVQPALPYGVKVAAEHTAAPPHGNAYVTIQYVPLQSEGASKT